MDNTNCENCSFFRQLNKNRAKCDYTNLPAYANAGADCDMWDLSEDWNEDDE